MTNEEIQELRVKALKVLARFEHARKKYRHDQSVNTVVTVPMEQMKWIFEHSAEATKPKSMVRDELSLDYGRDAPNFRIDARELLAMMDSEPDPDWMYESQLPRRTITDYPFSFLHVPKDPDSLFYSGGEVKEGWENKTKKRPIDYILTTKKYVRPGTYIGKYNGADLSQLPRQPVTKDLLPDIDWDKPYSPVSDEEYKDILKQLEEGGLRIPTRSITTASGYDVYPQPEGEVTTDSPVNLSVADLTDGPLSKTLPNYYPPSYIKRTVDGKFDVAVDKATGPGGYAVQTYKPSGDGTGWEPGEMLTITGRGCGKTKTAAGEIRKFWNDAVKGTDLGDELAKTYASTASHSFPGIQSTHTGRFSSKHPNVANTPRSQTASAVADAQIHGGFKALSSDKMLERTLLTYATPFLPIKDVVDQAQVELKSGFRSNVAQVGFTKNAQKLCIDIGDFPLLAELQEVRFQRECSSWLVDIRCLPTDYAMDQINEIMNRNDPDSLPISILCGTWEAQCERAFISGCSPLDGYIILRGTFKFSHEGKEI